MKNKLIEEFLSMMKAAQKSQRRHYGDVHITNMPCGCSLVAVVGESEVAFKDACDRHDLMKDDLLRMMKNL